VPRGTAVASEAHAAVSEASRLAAEADDEISKIILAESIRALDHQQKVLDSIRTRIAWVIAAGTVVTTFFGGLAVRNGLDLHWPSALATLSFIGMLGCSFAIGWPGWTWTFRSSTHDLLAWRKAARSPAHFRENLARWQERWLDQNECNIEALLSWFAGATGFLIAEVAFWLIELSGWGS
jgi:hypothetical protein